MQQKRILVLTDHMPWGHRSIARAIYGFLKNQEKENNFKVDYVEVKAETGPGNEIYTFLCRYMPSVHRLAYRLGTSKRSVDVLSDLSMRSIDGLKKAVGKYKPDLIISSYFLHSQALARWKEETKQSYKLWTVVADPRSITLYSFMKGADLHLVYDEVGAKIGLEKVGISKDKILATGWWVRHEMYQKVNRENARRKLGFNDDRPVVFVGGGSLGTSSLAALLPALMVVKKKVGVIFNSGTDKLIYNMIEEFGKMFRRLKRGDMVQIQNLGWIENMSEVLAACDIVFGKAGPNFIFDCMAMEKPFVAITHVGGQEDGNIELLQEKQLGWVKEKGNSAVTFFLDYVNNPKKYEEKYIKNIKEEAARNQKSMGIILERLKREITPPRALHR
jgi:UDP-N-acetylglucosamine:LPS N-acetylglucosamine transferase